jgi:hypothetical protein
MDDLTSSARLEAGDSSRSRGRLRCRFAVHHRASLRKKAPRAATACPAAVLRAGSCADPGAPPRTPVIRSGRQADPRGWHGYAEALAADSLTLAQGTDKTEGGKRRCLPGLNAGVFAPRLG